MKYVYIIRSEVIHNCLYVGVSSNPDKRLMEHNESKCSHTSKYKPWKLIYIEGFEFGKYAFSRETQIKKWSRGKKELLVRGVIGK